MKSEKFEGKEIFGERPVECDCGSKVIRSEGGVGCDCAETFWTCRKCGKGLTGWFCFDSVRQPLEVKNK